MTGILASIIGSSNGLGGYVSVPNLIPSGTAFGFPITASMGLSNSGEYSASDSINSSGFYCNPTSLASQLDARLTVVNGNEPDGSPVGTWLSLGTTRAWSITSFGGEVQSNCILEIRESVSQILRSRSNVTFIATSY